MINGQGFYQHLTLSLELACGGPCRDLGQYASFVQVSILKGTATRPRRARLCHEAAQPRHA